jgi:mRNA deadenylase 3'-5' endonuclease subunit Ccr4
MVPRWLPVALSAVIASAGGIIFKLISSSNDAEANEDRAGQQPTVVQKTGSLASASADEISIVSYNILADVFSKKLTYADESLLDWREHR